jgi:hypothetical protein
MGGIDRINELLEPDELPPANEDSAEYKAGFQAGKEGKPSDGKNGGLGSRVGRRTGVGRDGPFPA